MSLTLTEVPFSFLASGPEYHLAIPAAFEGLPNISTPLANGVGGRSFDFVPTYRDPGIDAGENEFVRDIEDSSGNRVQLWKGAEAPPENSELVAALVPIEWRHPHSLARRR